MFIQQKHETRLCFKFVLILIRFVYILLVGILSACVQRVQNNMVHTETVGNDSNQLYYIEKSIESNFLKAVENSMENHLYDTSIFKKVNGEIKLPILNHNGFVKFSDTLLNTDETDIREYTYVGQFERLGLYIIQGDFWESIEYYLIDKKTGVQTSLWNCPKVSPSENFIANLSMPYGLEGVPNGLQIWYLVKQRSHSIEQLSINKYLEIDQQEWVPIDFIWETEKSIILKVTTVQNYLTEMGQPDKNTLYYLRLNLNI